MENQTIERLIKRFSHIEGSKDFILLSIAVLSQYYKSSQIKHFIISILNQPHFHKFISISDISLSNMVTHWEIIMKNKASNNEDYTRQLFTYKALTKLLNSK